MANSGKRNIEEQCIDEYHDPQEEEYAELADSEGDKFDSRMFWFAGGVGALSLGYFQATGLLRVDPILLGGYIALILGIAVLLASLQFTSYIYGELSKLYRRKNKHPEEKKEIESIKTGLSHYKDMVDKGVPAFNVASMILVLGGTIAIIVYMFMNA